ncbi:flagellar hook-basal body complex protein [Ruminococcaceae bacterium OttesenSCG-928-L11]|nr:flagellar hook-basal body complex protein [Ruminococcaceae bacterium OttesenSCG-928-L11]
MMRSLSSAVAGLRSHQNKMDVIGNNISNVNTNGFKSGRVTFTDVYYQTVRGGRASETNRGGVNPTQIGYGSQLSTIDVVMGNAGGSYTGVATDVYIDGDGFLAVMDADENIYYTRMGNLGYDGRYLTDYTGKIVMGIPISSYATGATLNPTGENGFYAETDLSPVEFGMATFYDDTYQTKNAAIQVGNYERYDKALGSDGTTTYAQGSDGNYYDPVTGYPVYKDIFGKDVVYDPEDPKFFTTKNLILTDDTKVDLQYNLYPSKTEMIDDYKMATPSKTEEGYYRFVTDDQGGVAVFDTSVYATFAAFVAGELTTPKVDPQSSKKVEITYPDASGGPASKILTTQLKDQKILTGSTSEEKSIMDCITSFSIGSDGTISGVTLGRVDYNGETIEANEVIYLGKLVLANFANQDGLNSVGNSYYQSSPNSGNARYSKADTEGAGATTAGMLELSNVELSQEFTDMITTQRGFQANTRIITVSDEMLQELVNLKR